MISMRLLYNNSTHELKTRKLIHDMFLNFVIFAINQECNAYKHRFKASLIHRSYFTDIASINLQL